MALTSNGRIFIWGINNSGQLGNGQMGSKVTKPTLLSTIPKYITNIKTESYQFGEVFPEYIIEKTGYTFSGWYCDSLLTIPNTNTNIPAKEVSLYAKWNINTYSISYELDGGTNGLNPSFFTVETSTTPLADPIKEGYIFNGWYDNPEFIGEAINQIVVGTTGDITLFAKWKPNSITFNLHDFGSNVTFHSDYGNNLPNNQYVPFGYKILNPGILSSDKSSQVFVGWFDENGKAFDFETKIYSDIKLYAKWDFVNTSYIPLKDGPSKTFDLDLFVNRKMTFMIFIPPYSSYNITASTNGELSKQISVKLTAKSGLIDDEYLVQNYQYSGQTGENYIYLIFEVYANTSYTTLKYGVNIDYMDNYGYLSFSNIITTKDISNTKLPVLNCTNFVFIGWKNKDNEEMISDELGNIISNLEIGNSYNIIPVYRPIQEMTGQS